jgi:hypothetical protein
MDAFRLPRLITRDFHHIFIQSKGHAVNAMSDEITKLAIPVFSSGYMAYV